VRAPRIGDLVIVGADNKKRFDWPLGRIVELIPGRDGKIRVARVKTASGLLLRPIQRLYPLEMVDIESEKIAEAKEKAVRVESTVENSGEGKQVVTKAGRRVKQPIRYTAWNN